MLLFDAMALQTVLIIAMKLIVIAIDLLIKLTISRFYFNKFYSKNLNSTLGIQTHCDPIGSLTASPSPSTNQLLERVVINAAPIHSI
jgi:hypothetical protein